VPEALGRRALGWVLAGVTLVWRGLCRVRTVRDPRPALRAAHTPYVMALLHAHQVTGILANDERRGELAAMVSRSADGELVVPSMRARGIRPVRGSGGDLNKGGPRALTEMSGLLRQGMAGLLTVDGPKGPRNQVKRGVAELALRVPGAVVVPVLALPSRRWVLGRTWERFQIPLPFSRLSLVFGETVRPKEGEGAEGLRQRIEVELSRLEREWDPGEAAAASVEPLAAAPSLSRSA